MCHHHTSIPKFAAALVVLLLTFLALPARADVTAYFSLYNTNTVYKTDQNGVVSVLASGLNGPGGLAADSAGNIYTANYNDGTVTKITPAGVKSLYASGLGNPLGLVFDKQGNLYVANANSSTGATISKVNTSSNVTQFASGLSQPEDMVFDSQGNMFVTNWKNSTITKITSGGSVSFFANVTHPLGITIDAQDNLFVAPNSHIVDGIQASADILEISPGGSISTFTSTAGNIYGLKMDAQGTIYASQAFGSAQTANGIFRVASNGTISPFSTAAVATYVLPVPEPASMGLLSGSIIVLLLRRRSFKPLNRLTT